MSQDREIDGPEIHVRFFAGAAAAFGTQEATLRLPQQATLGDALSALVAPGTVSSATPEAQRVLGRCTYLVNKVSTTALDTPLPDGSRVDVLPPFAGG